MMQGAASAHSEEQEHFQQQERPGQEQFGQEEDMYLGETQPELQQSEPSQSQGMHQDGTQEVQTSPEQNSAGSDADVQPQLVRFDLCCLL
jgi:hypothetical protein